MQRSEGCRKAVSAESKISTPVERLATRKCACVLMLEFKGWAVGTARSGAIRAWIPSTDDISMI
jgi:hypothetical protein